MENCVIKFTIQWTSESHSSRLLKKTPNHSGAISFGNVNYIFKFDDDCKECDYWFVWGGIPAEIEWLSTKCDKKNVYFIVEEAHALRQYADRFLDQFAGVLTYRTDIQHKKKIDIGHEFMSWQLSKSFDDLQSETPILKSKAISVVCSNEFFLPGHRVRFAFVNRLIGHFKDKIDFFGRGLNPIDDKWDALAPYKYSICIENSQMNGYFTEKIFECYMAHCMPVYCGAPDIGKYFDERSFFEIDVNDYIGSIKKIEQLLEEDPYDSIANLLIEQKKKYLKKYHILPFIADFISKRMVVPFEKENVKIYNERVFQPNYNFKKITAALKNILYKNEA